MSGALSLALLPFNSFVFFKPFRLLGTIIPDCTIEERHIDRLRITDHPVELGSEISDHAFMTPFEVSIRYGWSLSSGYFDPTYIERIYEDLQELQQSRQPMEIFTGKRYYRNMLIEEMETETDSKTEYALMVQVHCRQVIIVATAAVSTAPASAQADPANTAGTVARGSQQLQPVSGVPGGAPT